jgi:hypothetical protein
MSSKRPATLNATDCTALLSPQRHQIPKNGKAFDEVEDIVVAITYPELLYDFVEDVKYALELAS